MSQFTHKDVEVLENTLAYKGFFELRRLTIKHALYTGDQTEAIRRELFLRGKTVGVLLYDPENDLVGFVEQFRVGALADEKSPWLNEIVAGILDSGLTLEQTAIKEVREETGLELKKLEPIASYWMSPGGTDEKMHLFCGYTDLRDAEGHFGCADEHEDIRFHVMPLKEVFAKLADGFFNNATTTIALQWLQIRLMGKTGQGIDL